MPAESQYDPFTILERSFHSASYKRYQRDIAEGYDRSRAMRLIPGSHSESPRNIDGSIPTLGDTSSDYMVAKPLVKSPRNLPPTPPSAEGDRISQKQEDLTVASEVFTKPSDMYTMRLSTPIHLRSPPTPDITPPNTRDRLHVPRPNLVHYPSVSQADSFVTARETLPSAASSQSQLPLLKEDSEIDAQAPNSQELCKGNGGIRHSVVRPLETTHPIDDLSLPQVEAATARTMPDPPQPKIHIEHKPALTTALHTGLFLGVTSQKPRSKRDASRSAGKNFDFVDTGDGIEVDIRHRIGRSGSLRETLKSDPNRKPPKLADAEEMNNALYTHLRDEKSKRLSANSESDTVVEAVVYATPLKPRRNLRHAGKNLALREDIDTLPQSRRVASDSYDANEHRLRHHKSPISGQYGCGIDVAVQELPRRVVSSPEAASRYRNEKHTRLIQPTNANSAALRRRIDGIEQQQLPSHPQEQHCTSAASGKDEEIGMQVNKQSGRPTKRHGSPEQAVLASHHLRHNDNDKRNLRAEFSPLDYGVSIKEDQPLQGAKTGWRRASQDVDLRSPEREKNRKSARRPSSVLSLAGSSDGKINTLLSTTRSVSESGRNPRKSSDHLTISSARRGSLEPRSDHAAARHVHSNNTPLSLKSQWSDRTENMEVSEATAVSFYPHNNESLLLVQQRASQRTEPRFSVPVTVNENSTTTRSNSARSVPVQPIFTAFVDSGTPPPEAAGGLHIDSPLTNPRAAPLPPAINFIPPTPCDEPDRQLGLSDDEESNKQTMPVPTRRESIKQKARRYSESFVQPLRTLSNSGRKRYTIDRPQERATNLHPSWRPRGFWDDFDSDDEDETFDDYPAEPLPKGGDMSDVGDDDRHDSFPRKMSRRMPGFRGTGGFMLGNSLGLGRHGTNNRRHYVDWPQTRVEPQREEDALNHQLRKRKSEHMLRTLAASTESLRRRRSADSGIRKRPRVNGMLVSAVGVPYGGILNLRERVKLIRGAKKERAAEKRREVLRGKIGTRVYHGS